MRARQIKPGFFTNEILVALPPVTRLLFVGLWCLADRNGRLEDKPERISIQILPREEQDVNDLLQQLADSREDDGSPAFIQRYEVKGRKYIQIMNFEKHQNPHVKEAPSTIPAPGQNGTRTGRARGKHHASHASSLTPSSLVLTPSSLVLTPSSLVLTPSSVFQGWYESYLRHEARAAAEKAFERLSDSDREECLTKSPAWMAAHRTIGTAKQFIPLPASYLNGKRWQDDIEAILAKGESASPTLPRTGRGGAPLPNLEDIPL